MPTPAVENTKLHIITTRGDGHVAADSHTISAVAGSPFAHSGSLYFSWGASESGVHPQVFQIVGTEMKPVESAEAAELMSSFATFTDATRAEGWSSDSSLEPSGTRDLRVPESAYVVHIARNQRDYELLLKAADGTIIYRLDPKTTSSVGSMAKP